MGEPLDDKEEEKQKEHEQQEQQSPANCSNSDSKKKRKRKEVAIFGNYRHYYGYRVSFVFSFLSQILFT